MDIRKALDTSSSTAQVFIPEVVDGAVRDYIKTVPEIYNLVTHQPWATNTYWVRKRTGKTTAAWRVDGGTLPAADNQTFTKVHKTVKYLYARGEVTGPMQEAAGSVYNALADEVQAHAEGLIEKLSSDLVTSTGAANDIEGILYQIDTTGDGNGSGNDFTATGGDLDVSGRTPHVLTLDIIDEAIDLTKGRVDLIICGSEKQRRSINGLLRANQRFNDTVEVSAGFRVRTYDGLPMVTVPEWTADGEMLFIRRSDAKLLVHKDVTFEELAKTKDSTDFMLKAYMGFALEGRPVHLEGFTLP